MRCGRAALLSLITAGCATHPAPRAQVIIPATNRSAAPPVTAAALGRIKIGLPYTVLGRSYTPSDDRIYDVIGIASWYGPGFHALSTASGERYDQDAISAAHKTLPLPCYVEVSNLDNGRTLVIRVNDRGPFVDGRIIDLSRRSAQLLGVDRNGTARVRVRRVYPDASVIAALKPPPTALPLLVVAAEPTPVALTAATPGTVFVQVAAVSDQGRAEWLRGYLAPFGATIVERSPGGLWRVRLGPYATRDATTPILAQVWAAGYTDARAVIATPN